MCRGRSVRGWNRCSTPSVTMVDVKKLLAIADLIIGICVALEGVVAIIWMFDTVFLLAIFVIGCYQIFFGAYAPRAWHPGPS